MFWLFESCGVNVSKVGSWATCNQPTLGRLHKSWVLQGFFGSWFPDMPLGHDVILRAIWKSTRETKGIVRERVLPWYKEEGWEKGKTSFWECTHSHSMARYDPKPNPYVGPYIYVNLGKKTLKRPWKRPYNVANIQRRESSFQCTPLKKLFTGVKVRCMVQKIGVGRH